MAQETGEPSGEPTGAAGNLALVELESEGVFKADIDSPTHLGLVELESENKSVATAIVQTETAAAGDLVLGAGVALKTLQTGIGASHRAASGLWRWSSWRPRKFSRN